ncbi:C39 family peptidase [Camelliibacillus cellulosilyticus]|uniref:C39 family peptidase n=1 Tax=Camelliibacillus cellulosilyticus TaxID=2174486 RepID=A0ABV9GK78_9BACL
MLKKVILILTVVLLSVIFAGFKVYTAYSDSTSAQNNKNEPILLKGKIMESPIVGDYFSIYRPERVRLDAPLIQQFPELPRGCEVTSLAMLLQFAGQDVGKMELAKKIKKDPTPYAVVDGLIHFGNPNNGFVGAMDTFDQPGLGVYHGPIADLAKAYLKDQVIDLSGKSFDYVLDLLADGVPVWVIINTRFERLSEDYWVDWETPEGPIQITRKEHSVLVTGYDDQWIYFNDPLTGQKNRKAERQRFIEGWEQMGSQAVSYLKTNVG